MKTTLKKFGTTKIIFSLLALTLFISACKKDWDNDPIEAAGIGFVHASPGTASLDFVLDNQKIGNFNYTNDKGYYAAYPGIRIIGVAKKDSLKYLANGNASLKGGSYYSAFVIDTLKSTSMLLVEDDLTAPETDKAKIRFINLSPRSAALDLAVEGNATALFTAKAFKEYTPFTSINPSESYTFQVKDAGSATVKASLPAVKIEKGKIYTIWAKGLSSTTDSTKFGIAVLTHK